MILLSLFWELGIKVIVCRMFVDVVHCANIVIDAIEVFSRPQASVSPMPLVLRFENLILDFFQCQPLTLDFCVFRPSKQCQTIQTNKQQTDEENLMMMTKTWTWSSICWCHLLRRARLHHSYPRMQLQATFVSKGFLHNPNLYSTHRLQSSILMKDIISVLFKRSVKVR